MWMEGGIIIIWTRSKERNPTWTCPDRHPWPISHCSSWLASSPTQKHLERTSCIFNVSDYGAVGDGDTNNTYSFRAAWKEAFGVENGVVLVPSDLVFLITSTIFSGTWEPALVFEVRSELFPVKVDGVLMQLDGPDSWPKSDSPKQWMVFYNLDGFTFTGAGMIEGNGQKWWDLPCKPHKVTKIKIIHIVHTLYRN